MREIKFRAWDEKKKIMDNEIHLSEHGKSMDYDHGTYSGDNDDIVMQYTGLKDKNGKEIYEGDIIEEYTYIAYCDDCHGYAMFFSNIEKNPYCAGCGGDFMWREFNEYPPEVIGNIHENPELLESDNG